MIREVQSELHSVRIQAGRARKLSEMKDEYRALKIKLLLSNLRQLVNSRVILTESLEKLQATIKELEAKKRALEEKLAEHGGRDKQAREDLSSSRIEHEQVSSAIRAAQKTISEKQDEAKNLAEQIHQLESDLVALDEKKGAIKKEIESLKSRREEVERKRLAIEEEILQAEAVAAEAEHEIDRLRASLEQIKSEIIELEHKYASYNNHLLEVAQQSNREKVEIAALKRQADAIEVELSEHQLTLKSLQIQNSQIAVDLEKLKDKFHASEANVSSLMAQHEQLEGDIQLLSEMSSRKTALRDSYIEMEAENHDIKQFINEIRENFPQVKGQVNELVSPDVANLKLTKAALADVESFLVVPDFTTALNIARYAIERNMDIGILVSNGAQEAESLPQLEGIAGSAFDSLLKIDDTLKPMFRAVPVVESIDVLQSLILSNIPVHHAVTKDGVVIRNGRGSASTVEVHARISGEESVIVRRALILQLSQEIVEIETSLTALRERIAQLDQAIRSSNEEAAALKQEIYEKTLELREVVNAMQQAEKQVKVRAKELTMLRDAITQRGANLQKLQEEETKTRDLISEMRDLRATLQRGLTEKEQLLKIAEANRLKLKESLAKFKLEQAKILADLKEVSTAIETNSMLLQDLEDQTLKAKKGIMMLRSRVEQCNKDIAEAEKQIADGRARTCELERKISQVSELLTKIEAELHEFNEQNQKTAEEIRVALEEQYRLGLEDKELTMKIEQLKAQAREELESDLLLEAGRFVDSGDTNVEDLQRTCDKLRTRIASYGNVNMLAIERLVELEERERTLVTQRADVAKSKAELEQFVKEIDAECHRIFDETISKIREVFNELYRKLFNGGKADIIIEKEDGVDPLEYGVEITAKPPKKEATKLSMLSGGEVAHRAGADSLILQDSSNRILLS